jgi:G3E family GTPase
MPDSKIPVTILTGFLGSGKTTLLNRILSEEHGQRVAVIENEFGEVGVDQALVINADEEIFEMNNGCICCTVRGDLIRVLGNLMKRRDRFDRVLVETTGLADPGPVAQTFFMDEDIQEDFRLDGVVTLVDAKHLEMHLEDSKEAREQVAFADVLVLNKIDLVPDTAVDSLERKIRGMNAMAQILRSRMADVPIASVLDIGGFDLERALEHKPTFLEPEYPFEWSAVIEADAGVRLIVGEGPDPTMSVVVVPLTTSIGNDEGNAHAALASCADRVLRLFSRPGERVAPGGNIEIGEQAYTLDLTGRGQKTFTIRVPARGRYALFTEHTPEEFALRLEDGDGTALRPAQAKHHAAGHTHDDTVTSVGIELEGEVDADRFNRWLGKLLRERGVDIFRSKGILNIKGDANRFVFQGVHMLLDGGSDRPWGKGKRLNQLCFIGRKLDRAALDAGFRACLA